MAEERTPTQAEQEGRDAASAPGKPADSTQGQPSQASAHDPAELQRVLRIEVPVIVRLADRTMPIRDIVDLTPGSIIEFDKPADAPLDLMINNKCIGHGRAVKVGENFGLELIRIAPITETVRALGPRKPS